MQRGRRKFLKVIGGTSVILAAGAGGWVATRAPERARLPWTEAGRVYADPMRNALSYAILAPNPHNRQPWLVDLKSDTEATLFCQLNRLLPETDPFNRQITIGLGCFLEIFGIAAAESGYRAEIDIFPEGSNARTLDARAIAHIRLVEDTTQKKDPLFTAILNRRTNRTVFDETRNIAQSDLDAIDRSGRGAVRVSVLNDARSIASLKEIGWQASLVETKTPEKHGESVGLMRIGKDEIEKAPDGISLGGPFLEVANRIGYVTRESLADPASGAFAESLDYMRPLNETAGAFIILATAENNRVSQIEAGRDYVRANLTATVLGISMQPHSQALQEYNEMKDLYRRIHAAFAEEGETLQMLARIGYGTAVPPAPRWALDTRIVAG
ncbi:Acg family FMN-binding oxidoreductase [Kiloniella laminariae]|uniref:Acg family FMN-binding oxidoreductase n=1 Tax=Kiloniella laminariae TaxID=454162 RepID=UPI00035E6DC2|nr:hypothetical protein [Kiloniella laminariae]